MSPIALSSMESKGIAISDLLENRSSLVFGIVVTLGVILRVLVAFRDYNFDVESYRIVADLVAQGKNVYANTPRYNYGPIWFHILSYLDRSPWFPSSAVWALRWKVTFFLTGVDLGIAILLLRWFGTLPAVLFFLNPISIIITGYHSQFDNLAVLIGLLSARLLERPVDDGGWRQGNRIKFL